MTRTVRIILHRNSACSSVDKGIYNSAGGVQFSSASTNAAVCADVPWTVCNICRDGFQGTTCLPDYACRILSARKAAVFYDNDDDGTGLMQNFRRQTTEPDLEVVEPIAFHRKRTHDLKPIFALIADDEVDATFVARRQGGCYSKSAMWLCRDG
jgi:ABC-type branched-subunit amino acid transport system substrate-binding protein